MLWGQWLDAVKMLRAAFSRQRTYLWFCVGLMGLTVRRDLAGVSSSIRALGLRGDVYIRLLRMFHSDAIKTDKLAELWLKTVKHYLSKHLYRVNDRLVLLGDGIKIPKEGKKMPGVKSLHQESESNTKPEFIMGHSCQCLSIVAGSVKSFFSVPLMCRIHEGVVLSNRCTLTLLDKMMRMLARLNLDEPCYFVADNYYASRKVILPLLADDHHLISRVRTNATAYRLPGKRKKGQRGRHPTYGKKCKIKTLFKRKKDAFESIPSPVYGENNVTIRYYVTDLLWRPVGILVRFVLVDHPQRGQIILMSTDRNLEAEQIISLYGLRYKIEVSFKQARQNIGTFDYHFWMKGMKPIKRKQGDQYLHRKSEAYRAKVLNKLHAYHVHIQMGIIAQGLLQMLSLNATETVWQSFGSWLRTIRKGVLPTEPVVMMAMQNTLYEFLNVSAKAENLVKFLKGYIDNTRIEGKRLVGS